MVSRVGEGGLIGSGEQVGHLKDRPIAQAVGVKVVDPIRIAAVEHVPPIRAEDWVAVHVLVLGKGFQRTARQGVAVEVLEPAPPQQGQHQRAPIRGHRKRVHHPVLMGEAAQGLQPL